MNGNGLIMEPIHCLLLSVTSVEITGFTTHMAPSPTLNTLRTGDADLRFYITTVQDG